MITSFNGPLFIVGMPRSGTKLLRSLLNEHSCISIPNVETHFIPYWYANWSSYGDLKDKQAFTQFYHDCLSLPYFQYMSENNPVISLNDWYQGCTSYTLEDIFEVLVRHDAKISVDDEKCIWGDKTPSYLVHMRLLKKLYPDARFIHILRDARDYCLSSKKAWGKNIYRSAQAWNDRVEKAMIFSEEMPDDVLTIKYESLLESTETTLRAICDFISIDFEPSMMTLSTVPENLGDATGSSAIITDNKAKYKKRMNLRTQLKVEAITKSTMLKCAYPIDYKGESIRLSAVTMMVYKLMDGINLLLFEIKNRGLVSALKLRIKLFTTTRYNG